MIKDFEVPEVKDVEIAIVKEGIETGNIEWNVYIINKKSVEIDTVLITSQGYGTLNGQERKSSLLRHFFKAIPANTFEKVEPILEDLFELDNEYWLSFYFQSRKYF
jgi:hypothetical protein